MWDLYTKKSDQGKGNGVVLATTFDKMAAVFDNHPSNIALGAVAYQDILNHHLRSDYIFNEKTRRSGISFNDDFYKYTEPFSRLFRKDLMFNHEQEVRAVIDLSDDPSPNGQAIFMPYNQFIDRIIVSPYASDSYIEEVREMAIQLGFTEPEKIVITSNILREISTKNMRKEDNKVIINYLE
jgi:hypothetical protein